MTDIALHQDSKTALDAIRKSANPKDTVVFISGNFNIVHPGHLRLLRFAAECGDYLVVGVLDDSQGVGILPELLRLESVDSIGFVDHSFILHDKPENFIASLKPDIVVKGKEHETKYNPELETITELGGKLLFSSGDMTFSSIDLLKDEFQKINPATVKKPLDFQKRHGFSNSDLFAALNDIKNLKVLVIGDIIVDEYIDCDPLGMSQEDPTIVVTPVYKEVFAGAAGIVAAHVRGLGAKARLFSVVGKDESADFARQQLKDYDVSTRLYVDPSRPTTLKQRYRAAGKTLLRVNHLRQHNIEMAIQKDILNDLTGVLDDTDLVIFSDFNYGCLPQGLVDKIMIVCKKKNIMMVADSQSSSQIGDVSRFKNMSLITPTEREARLAVQDFGMGLVVLAEELRTKSMAKNVLMTLGKEGLLIHAEVSASNEWLTDRLPAMSTDPKDVSGAGDSLLTCTSMAMAAGYDIWISSYLGSIAAACQVSRIGNTPLTAEELKAEIAY